MPRRIFNAFKDVWLFSHIKYLPPGFNKETSSQEITERERVLEAKIADMEAGGATVEEINELRGKWVEEKAQLKEQLEGDIVQLEDLRRGTLLTENRYQELTQKFGSVFEAGIGAEAILQILKNLNLDELHNTLVQEIRQTSGQRRKKASKQLQVVEAFRRSGNKPEWMIITVLPVLPPDLRPMVQLDGDRFATSDLNDLYRRVINRNNRLRHLQDIGAPEVIIRNEKRMLQPICFVVNKEDFARTYWAKELTTADAQSSSSVPSSSSISVASPDAWLWSYSSPTLCAGYWSKA